MPVSLRARLLVAFLVVVGSALGTVGVAVLLVGPGYFSDAMGHAVGDPLGASMDAATHAAFGEAMRGALLAATLIAVVTSIVVAFAVASRIARPIADMATAAHRIAEGHYAERVAIAAPDEIGQLGASFNAMAASLESTERRRVQLVGDIAHELRTPLTTIDGYLEGLQDGVVPPTEATWRLLRSEAHRLTLLVSDLGDLWRAESDQLALNFEPVDLAAVARDVCARFAPLASQKHLRVDAQGAATAWADRNRVTQILSNYLSNAIRYAPDGSRIAIDIEDGAEGARLAVTDQGPGLTPDQLEAVFLRFYRVDAARSRAAGGSGIGLAIVAALATAMGGHAWAESRGPGKGSTFLATLPSPVLTNS